ncbi:MAG: hypothetical protein ACOH5I_18285 [Oligoflexus sp.]
MIRTMAKFSNIRLLFALAFTLTSGNCAVEVGNPHPDRDAGTQKASVDVSIINEQAFNYDSVGLNIVGFGLVSQQNPENTVTFSARKSVVIVNTDVNQSKRILYSTTPATGKYDTIRVLFSRSGVGEIKSGEQVFPIEIEGESNFIDVPVNFELLSGKRTKIKLGFNSTNLLEEFRNSDGQLVSYTFKSQFDTDVDSENIEVGEEDPGEENKLFRSYRLTVLEVNDDRQVNIRRLKLMINNEWQTNEFKTANGLIGMYTATISESSSDSSNYGWKALSGGAWQSANRTFDGDSRQANDPEGEYVQFDFALPVSMEGIEFSGDGNEKCAVLYRIDRMNAQGQWETVPETVSETEACSTVNMTW